MPTDINPGPGPAKRNILKKKRYPVERETEFLRRLGIRFRPFDAQAEAALFSALANSPYKAAGQLRLLAILMLETAARLNELVMSRWENFDLAQKQWTAPPGKYARAPRVIPLSASALSALAELRALPTEDPGCVFPAFQRPCQATALMGAVARTNRLDQKTARFPTLRREGIIRMLIHNRTWPLGQVIDVAGGRAPRPPKEPQP